MKNFSFSFLAFLVVARGRYRLYFTTKQTFTKLAVSELKLTQNFIYSGLRSASCFYKKTNLTFFAFKFDIISLLKPIVITLIL